MASNSIAPSRKALDLYLDGADWKVALYAPDGTTQATSTTIGTVDVSAASVVVLPLDLRAMGGDAAHELRIFLTSPATSGVIKVIHTDALESSFPVAGLTVIDAEVIGQQVEKIVAIGSGIGRIRIAWG